MLAVMMIDTFLLLLFAQWYSTTNAVQAPSSCYYSANETLDSVFMPCGDYNNGFKPCCQAGDNCLANNACYSPDHGTTYLAGCTDEEYSDGSCPLKPGLQNHSWVGLVTCNGVSTNWFACGDNGPTVTHGMGCTCPKSSATLAFTAGGSPIQNIMQLGSVWGESSCFPSFTEYCPYFSPTSTAAAPSSTATSAKTPAQTSSPSLTTESGGSVSTVYYTITKTAPSNNSAVASPTYSSSYSTTPGGLGPGSSSFSDTDTGLQTPAYVGIGVGSAVGAVSAVALLWYCVRRMRKRQKKNLRLLDNDQTGPNDDADGFAGHDKLGDDDPRSPTWSGHKSELPADKDPRSPTCSGHKSELPADENSVRSPVPTYEPYRGSYRSTQTAEVEGSPRHGGQSSEPRGEVYEMP